ncbi:MAG: glycosyltransferase family 4 protein [Methanothrix sp.]|jgi:glycosyltransferase involved in cell wall biosynthesis|nr:glycosyltransferase family 4 protein [Methanothrix sp.]
MKIAQVISTPPFAWATGGCARVAFELSKELATRGHEITIITTDLYKPNKRYDSDPEIINGIEIKRFRYISDYLAWHRKIYISPALIKNLKNNLINYDIVHLHDLISLQAYYTSKYCKMYEVPYVVSTHGSVNWLCEKRFLNTFYKNNFGINILNNSKIITTLNAQEAKMCESIGIGKKKIKVLSNPINLADYSNLPKKNNFKNKYNIKNNYKVVLYLGRVEKSKGLDLLLSAFSDVIKDIENSILVIVGPDDGYLPNLIRIVKSLKLEQNVIITGYIDEDEKLAAYLSADVHVSPRPWEPFGITLIESCACGTPVICSKGCGIADIIESGAGFTFSTKEDLKKCLINILSSNDNAIKKIRTDCKQIVSNHFDSAKIADKLENIYKKVLLKK